MSVKFMLPADSTSKSVLAWLVESFGPTTGWRDPQTPWFKGFDNKGNMHITLNELENAVLFKLTFIHLITHEIQYPIKEAK